MTATLMVQGTTSGAGKSVIATGLCRLLRNRGYRVAPFKPQNMALNSAVTEDGGEIGRAQAVQALACGLAPHTDMNPILLKPSSDTGAQVIINGQPIGMMNAREYHGYKKTAFGQAQAAYRRLAARYDFIIIEGAGSPAEVNLREHDLANMGFAMAVHCPVVLVADIDRGGVFAHLLGTLACLTAAERQLIGGFLINRFRGDRTLLAPGIDWLTEKTAIPTRGVLPYLTDLHIEAEDTVDTRSFNQHAQPGIKIVVPRLPRMSNHTDFDALRLHPQVDLQFVPAGSTIPPNDLIILPGSKNTIDDLDWLRQNQWPEHINKHLRYGGKVIGICGGYQMLGMKIDDTDGIEGTPKITEGLGLLELTTQLSPTKQLRRVTGVLCDSGAQVCGYEIHMGVTHGPALTRPAIDLGEHYDGVRSADNQIFGTYLHGVFDHAEACTALLQWAGATAVTTQDYAAMHERAIERVSTMLQNEINIPDLLDCVTQVCP